MMREQFDQTMAGWHSILEALPEHGTARATAFMTAADMAALYVAAGLDRDEVCDDLERLATAHGLDDDDAVKWIIMRALDE
jgi:hypothetical protein